MYVRLLPKPVPEVTTKLFPSFPFSVAWACCYGKLMLAKNRRQLDGTKVECF
jgi:hypothetical protein